MGIPLHDEMHAEWLRWQAVVSEARTLDLDLNDAAFTPLVRAIEGWGEELVRLRFGQPAEVANTAYREKIDLADSHLTDEAKADLRTRVG